MKKIESWPIGLGMNHLEQEAAAARCWNRNIDNEQPQNSWLPIHFGQMAGVFSVNYKTGLSLEKSGFVEVEGDRFRLTEKAIELLKEFTEKM